MIATTMGEDSFHDTGWLGYVIQGDRILRLLLVVECGVVLID